MAAQKRHLALVHLFNACIDPEQVAGVLHRVQLRFAYAFVGLERDAIGHVVVCGAVYDEGWALHRFQR